MLGSTVLDVKSHVVQQPVYCSILATGPVYETILRIELSRPRLQSTLELHLPAILNLG